MCNTDQPSIPQFNAAQAQATMKSGAVGAGIVMVVFGAVGLAVALTAGGQLADARAAYSAGLIAIVIAGIMVIAVGALRGHLTLLRHQLASEGHFDERLDKVEKQHDQMAEQYQRLEQQYKELGELMQAIRRDQDRQAKFFGEVLEDEVGRLRRDRRGG